MAWKNRPRCRKCRVPWLKRFLHEQRKCLARGFLESWHGRRHWTVQAQVKKCLTYIRRAEAELEALSC
jgi:hypothetical protein